MRRAAVLAALVAALLLLVGALPATSPGADTPSGLSLVGVAQFDSPVGVVAAPGDRTRLFVVEQGGRIAELRGRTTSVFADLTDRVQAGSEQGLLGLAFAPDYATSGKLYVYYTAKGGGDVVVSELRRRDADHADVHSERIVLRIPHRAEAYENGGQLAFGPDGKLWIGTGDGGDAARFGRNSQLLDPAADDAAAGYDALLGKLLRIDPAPGDGCGGGCTIPADNPGFAAREVWAYGLRNPWRFSFDPVTHDLYIADVGDYAWEEVDVAPAAGGQGKGVDFGWPFFEGLAAGPDPGGAPAGCCTPPAIVRSHDAPENWNALIGGVVVRDPGLPALTGQYLYGALNQGTIRAATVRGGSVVSDVDTGLVKQAMTSFGTDGCGRVYVTSLDGGLYRIEQGAGACDAVGVTLKATAGQRPQRTGAVRASVACAVACQAQVQVSLRSGAAVLGRSTPRTIALAGGTAKPRTVTLRVTAAVRAAVRRAQSRHRTVTARVVVTAQAASGGAQRRSTAELRVGR
ncbi:MAG TPA: PQQ-dependent sugar dehydrogenase [Baekduia sp.]